jgi:hypothetical protein
MSIEENFAGASVIFTVQLIGNRVVVSPNGGNVRGHGGKVKITWQLSAADVNAGRTFTLDFSSFDLEDDPQGATADSPLDGDVASVGPVTSHADRLKRLAHGNSQLISKYTVTINNAPGAIPLDPVIIVDR